VEVIGTDAKGFASGLFAQANRSATGNGGNLRIVTKKLIVQDGAEVSASTYGEGQGGSLEVTAAESVEVIGTDARGFGSGLFAQATRSATGDGGNLRISAGKLIVQDGAEVTVSSKGSGPAGNLEVQADSILVDNQGRLIAETVSGEGGNISLQARDLFLMRGHSSVSTNAGGSGNGGNITLNAPFLVAVPVEDSNITANAVRGWGGNINITTSGIYGLKFRPRDTPLSDITATSEFGVNGTVQINTLGIDPSQGLANLPEQLVDASGLVGAGCAVAVRQDSNFVVTGRGGLPSSPNDTLRPANVLVNLGTQSNSIKAQQSTVPTPESLVKVNPDLSLTGASFSNPTAPLVEATGWVKDSKGEVILIAQTPTVTAHSSWLTTPNCEGR
jgi:large exoprotein involved in heme utilization and adhesion